MVTSNVRFLYVVPPKWSDLFDATWTLCECGWMLGVVVRSGVKLAGPQRQRWRRLFDYYTQAIALWGALFGVPICVCSVCRYMLETLTRRNVVWAIMATRRSIKASIGPCRPSVLFGTNPNQPLWDIVRSAIILLQTKTAIYLFDNTLRSNAHRARIRPLNFSVCVWSTDFVQIYI